MGQIDIVTYLVYLTLKYLDYLRLICGLGK